MLSVWLDVRFTRFHALFSLSSWLWRKTMQNNRLLFIGIGLAFAGSLLITRSDLFVQVGGILLGGVGAMCVLIGLFRG
jgi:hypothetical protein